MLRAVSELPALALYGTVTSPYVRRIRILAHELGLPLTMVDTATDAGQAELRATNPLWKVPACRIGETLVFDSGVITQALLQKHGRDHWRPLAPDTPARNRITVADGVLDALINTFYLAKDGITPTQASYVQKQHDRAAAAMAWLDAQVGQAPSAGFGVTELAICTALEWMQFRGTYPVSDHANLVALVGQFAERPSMVATRPPGA